ncbi:carbamoyltransferase HypF [Novosphingobium sp. FSW06-99]|uniref:carbamoyltransferase HypF n=1 Tax=Novosphingobium sp. FSW06-99 TaxID=1739113 RepID=UPI00076BCCF8|nr:carbamoyltransferase HypF [Novosphingobium sp. FSW06-99]KUR72012.1 carbamoyltransferase [Novosphingobium sp. FSW06-99]
MTRRRLRVHVSGAVQGVGFRPFVFALAQRYALSGFVCNDARGVLAELEGDTHRAFLWALRSEHPPLARIDRVDVTSLPALGSTGFAIRASLAAGAATSRAIPDAATCSACLADLFDPASRFYHYPFVTCTDCGPRFTITRRQPYDRANTAMADFAFCGQCAADYADPGNRRFHAETLACPDCGPQFSHTVQEIAAILRVGGIVALKGIGGFHLLCDATNETAVARLRLRKRRPARPFAIMLASDGASRPFASPTAAERDLLNRSARPIVIVRKGTGLAPSVCPRLRTVGVMLPSAPVHHLIFHALERNGADGTCALVVTSANLAGDPLVIAGAAAAQDLSPIADLVVTHNRPILIRADDSVMAVIAGEPAFVRRARGYVPDPIDLGEDGPTVIALGAHLKATVCVTHGREAFVSQHVGDLDSAQTRRFHHETVQRLLAELGIRPECVACDLHPDYGSTVVAQTLDLPVLRVQHHAAHLAAVAAEHRLHGPLVGLALDGHGHGSDGMAWGGELLIRTGGIWHRHGHLRPLPLPGGDRAAREPWRMGMAAMVAMGRGAEAERRFSRHPLAAPLTRTMTADGPVTTSMGRLFDAAAALLGVCEDQSYDGQAAMELEALVDRTQIQPGGYHIIDGMLDFTPLLGTLLQPGIDAQTGAGLFHGTVIAGLAEWIGAVALAQGQTRVVLGGGCFMNRVLAEGLALALRRRGLEPWLPRLAPANDGGIALGQAAIARAHLMQSNRS